MKNIPRPHIELVYWIVGIVMGIAITILTTIQIVATRRGTEADAIRSSAASQPAQIAVLKGPAGAGQTPVIGESVKHDHVMSNAAARRRAVVPVPNYVGIWTGQWDDKYKVRFTIENGTGSADMWVQYEWEEKFGKPLFVRRLAGRWQDNLLRLDDGLIDLSFSLVNSNDAQAIGHFATTRSARLTRIGTLP